MKKIVLFIITALSCVMATGQIHFIIPPLIDGVFTPERVFQFSVSNADGRIPFQGNITATLTRLNGEQVAVYQSAFITLKPGETQNGFAIDWVKGAQFGAGEEGKRLRETGTLVFGDYALCYTTSGNMKTRNCTEVRSEPQMPPRLVYPEDQETIATLNPLLSWLPPTPSFDLPYTYSMKLVALKSGQSCPQALQANAPVAQFNRYEQTSFPMDGRDGQDMAFDKTYCWQVNVYYKNAPVAPTEIWRFTPRLPERRLPAASAAANMPYLYLKHQLDGEIARVSPLLKFIYDNRLGSATLKYAIYSGFQTDAAGAAGQPIALKEGVNYLTLDCSALPNLKANQPYILEVTDDNNSAYFCRFVYVK